MPPEKKYRIKLIWAIAWIILAIIADVLSLIPLVGIVTGPLFWILFSWYLWKVGCGLVNGKQLATSILSTVGEIIPAIQALPLATVGAIIVILFVYFEDKTGISVPLKASGPKANVAGVRQPPPRIHANEGGMRPPNGALST